ncbi:MAG: ribulose-phosphate 3-epimerase [Candidatus Pelagibacterales bacterium]|jgi:ribulose-phosphate 3-epimerase|tara:strand:+ start:26 stop:688 length:663 start_codon:yes stop_codon:yes gene_type:complete
MNNKIKISPSILASDFSQLGNEVIAIAEAGADYIHVDVMDGHFVPNLTIGPGIVKSIRDKTDIPFDVHLMIDPIEPYIDEFAKAGADIISIHPEANDNTDKCIDRIKSHNVKAGLAINPDTDWKVVLPYLNKIDLIIVMSVHPGFGGQKFIPSALEKLKQLRAEIDNSNLDIELEIDGGINFENIQSVIDAGANVIVAGTTTFAGGKSEYANNITRLRGQ